MTTWNEWRRYRRALAALVRQDEAAGWPVPGWRRRQLEEQARVQALARAAS